MTTPANRFVVGPDPKGRSAVLQRVLTNVHSREKLPSIVTVATLTERKQRQLRDDILAAVSRVPGVIEAMSVRFSQIAIGYGDSNETFAPGTRVNPDTFNADDLRWSLLTPDAGPPDLPHGFNVTVCKDVSQPVAVRPDGIVASAELVHQLFGFNLDPHTRS